MSNNYLARSKSLMKWYKELNIDDIIINTAVCHIKNDIPDAPAAEPEHAYKLFDTEEDEQNTEPGIVKNAQNAVKTCKTLDDVYQQLEQFEGLDIKNTATNLVFSDGNHEAPIMLIGEAPGREEDLKGKPFVGKSGQLLDQILNALHIKRNHNDPNQAVFISNTVFWRPPGNRKPSEIETMACKPFIEKIIECANPKIMVLLGATAAQTILETKTGIMQLRGKWHTYTTKNNKTIPTMPTFHPAFLLRQPSQKALIWKDFIDIKTELDKIK